MKKGGADGKKNGKRCMKSAARGRTGFRKCEKCREKESKGGKSNWESLKKTKIGEEGMPNETTEKKRASEGEK